MKFDAYTGSWGAWIDIDNFEVLTSNSINNLPFTPIVIDNCTDSTAILNLTIDNSVFVIDSVTICDGVSVTVGTSIYDTAGNYIDTLATTNGCDSIVNTTIEIIDVNISQNDTTICS